MQSRVQSSPCILLVLSFREVLIPSMPVEDGQVNPVGGTFAFVQFFQFDKIVFNEASQPAVGTWLVVTVAIVRCSLGQARSVM